jgi:hypothetical protein
MYVPPIRLIMRKMVAAIRSAGRTAGLISASIKFPVLLLDLLVLKFPKTDVAESLEIFRGS